MKYFAFAKCEIKFAITFAQQIFHSEAISYALAYFTRRKANFIEKERHAFSACLSFSGSPCWARTSDIMINSHALYRLS